MKSLDLRILWNLC